MSDDFDDIIPTVDELAEWIKNELMTDAELVQLLSDGDTVAAIAMVSGINRRTLEKRVLVLRDRCLCKTVAQLVANYLRKGLIK